MMLRTALKILGQALVRIYVQYAVEIKSGIFFMPTSSYQVDNIRRTIDLHCKEIRHVRTTVSSVSAKAPHKN